MNRLALLEKCHACTTRSTPATLPAEIAACATYSTAISRDMGIPQILNQVFMWCSAPQGHEYFNSQYVSLNRPRSNI